MVAVNVSIEGFGVVSIKTPKKLNKKTWADSIAQAVAETLKLTHPQDVAQKFHPAIGTGGYGGNIPVPASSRCYEENA